jgi:predicted DNA-binding transcriptional regulator YafY
MLETSARLLRLLSLLQTHRDWTGPDLAERLEVGTRTLRRDVDRLRRLGYSVEATSGPAGGYRLGIGAALPPLLLDDAEAVAIAVGLRTVGDTVAGLAEAAEAALAKLERVLPVRLRDRVDALTSSTVLLAGSGPTVQPDALIVLARACRESQPLRFGYLDGRDERSERTVEPHRLVSTGRRWYLVAHDRDRDDWRTFRVDRIEAPTATGRRFTPRAVPDLASLVSRSISVAPYRWQARVRVQASAVDVAALVPPTVGWVEEFGTECLLHVGADNLDNLAAYLIALGHPFEVLEPARLRERVREIAVRLLADHPAPISAEDPRTADATAGTRPDAGPSRPRPAGDPAPSPDR